MKPRVLILGASRYYIKSIAAARELGFEVIATDRNPQAEGFAFADAGEAADISDVGATLAVARKYNVQGVIAVNDFGVQTAAVVATELGLPGLDPEVARIATSKALMRQTWQKAGLPAVAFRVVKTLEEAQQAVRELDRWPLIFKPADSRGGGSRGVSRVDSAEEVERAFAFAQAFYADPTVVIEEFLSGIEHSVETLTVNGDVHVIAVSDKVKTLPPHRVDKSVIYPTALPEPEYQRLREAVIDAVKSIGITNGAAHVELCSTERGPLLFELGARTGGGATPDPIVPYVTGVDLFKEVVRVAVGMQPTRLEPIHQRGCIYHFLTPEPGVVSAIHGVEEVLRWPGVLDCGVLKHPGDTISEVRTGADRAGFVVAGANTREEAVDLAHKAERHIRFEYAGAEAGAARA